jgi:hypothetical protein
VAEKVEWDDFIGGNINHAMSSRQCFALPIRIAGGYVCHVTQKFRWTTAKSFGGSERFLHSGSYSREACLANSGSRNLSDGRTSTWIGIVVAGVLSIALAKLAVPWSGPDKPRKTVKI